MKWRDRSTWSAKSGGQAAVPKFWESEPRSVAMPGINAFALFLGGIEKKLT
jgi:hypothetical protein